MESERTGTGHDSSVVTKVRIVSYRSRRAASMGTMSLAGPPALGPRRAIVGPLSLLLFYTKKHIVEHRGRVCVKSVRKSHFAFRTSDDVEWKTQRQWEPN